MVGRAGKLLRLIRMMRILRVFKFVRHLTGLQSLLSSIKHAYQELGLLMVLLWVISVTLSRYCQLQTAKYQILSLLSYFSLLYFAEKDGRKKWTFAESFWWGLMAMTSVGNGEKVPSAMIGKVQFNLFSIV